MISQTIKEMQHVAVSTFVVKIKIALPYMASSNRRYNIRAYNYYLRLHLKNLLLN